MHETKAVVHTLKKCLKGHHLKYRDVAAHLNISEASVKRLFSHEDITLTRLEQILTLMDMRLIDLLELLEAQEDYISQLAPLQEESLIKDPKLLLTFFLLLNGWQLTEITQIFTLESLEMVRLLAQLDKLKLIELLPYNKVKLLTASNFSWRKNGPVQKFFEDQVLADFFKNKFDNPNAKMVFLGGMLSEASIEKLKTLMDDYASKANDLMRDDLKLPLGKRFSVGTVLAVRRWELGIFAKLRRNR